MAVPAVPPAAGHFASLPTKKVRVVARRELRA
jgi:hypothetical protein